MASNNTTGTSIQPQDVPLKSFCHFPNLPVELRLKIWKLLHPPARVLVIEDEAARVCRKTEMNDPMVILFGWWIEGKRLNASFQPRPVPTVLHVCPESREQALKSYKLSLRTPIDQPQFGGVYIDFDIDILYLGISYGPPEQLFPVLFDTVEDLHKVQNFAYGASLAAQFRVPVQAWQTAEGRLLMGRFSQLRILYEHRWRRTRREAIGGQPIIWPVQGPHTEQHSHLFFGTIEHYGRYY